MIKVTADELTTLTSTSGKFTLVDIYADWCGPCKRMTPVVEALEEEFTSINVVKVDADDQHEYAGDVGIRSIPTLIMYNDAGIEVDRWTGNQDVNDIRTWITETL